MDSIIEKDRLKTAQDLDTSIKAGFNMMASGLYDTCVNLKKMHDGAYFSELGYDTLEAYTKDRYGIGTRQTYTYIQALENLGEEFLKSNAKLGITKLQLLATVPVFDREAVVENNDLSSMSVPQVKELVKKPVQESFDDYSDSPAPDTSHEKEAQKKIEEQQKEIERLKEELAKPQEHFKSDEIQKLKDKNKKLTEAHKGSEETIRALRDAKQGLDIRIKQEQDEAERLRQELEAEKQKREKAEAMAAAEAAKAEEAQKAAQKPVPVSSDPKEIFKAYYSNVLAAVSPCVDFIAKQEDKAFYTDKLKKLSEYISKKAEEMEVKA